MRGSGCSLAGLADVARQLDGLPVVTATRADLLRRSGRLAEAEAAYATAISMAGTCAERRLLQRRLAQVQHW